MNEKKLFVTEEEIQMLRDAARVQCSTVEMAAMFGCSRDLFYQRPELMKIIEEERAGSKRKMRKLMVDRALYDGNDEYLIGISQKALEWVSKWYLDQRENAQVQEEASQNKFLPPAATLDDKVSGDD